MLSVFDVAAYIIKEIGPVTTWKLQKLLYYSQAWSLVWDEQPLFDEEFEAWGNGPACRELYNIHRGQFLLNELPIGDAETLNEIQKSTVNVVLKGYADKRPQWLNDLSVMEDPWKNARRGLSPCQRGNSIISKESLQLYYGSLREEDEILSEEE